MDAIIRAAYEFLSTIDHKLDAIGYMRHVGHDAYIIMIYDGRPAFHRHDHSIEEDILSLYEILYKE